jgi:hypothetical protein
MHGPTAKPIIIGGLFGSIAIKSKGMLIKFGGTMLPECPA